MTVDGQSAMRPYDVDPVVTRRETVRGLVGGWTGETGRYAVAMSATYLDDIMAFHRARAAADDREWRDRVLVPHGRASLRGNILNHRSRGLSVIAEVKRRSPSKGWLAEGLDAAVIAEQYARGGATGLSVLTDEPHFGGSLDDLRRVAAHVDLPLLRKDFTVSPNDVLDAAEARASAVLLIVAALSDDEVSELLSVAETCGLDALVEVHDEAEVQRALDLGATFIGINQRDLRTFAVDTERAERVLSSIPAGVVVVAESGFSSRDAVRRAAASGFDAVLVGENFVTSQDPASEVASFVGHPLGGRHA